MGKNSVIVKDKHIKHFIKLAFEDKINFISEGING